MLQTNYLLPIVKGGVLHTQTPVHDSRCCKRPLSYPFGSWKSYPPKLHWMTLDTANDVSPAQLPRGSFTHPNSSAWLYMLQMTFVLHTSKGGVLPTQTPLHYSRYCKRRFYYPLEREESYPPKLQIMTQDVASDFSPALNLGGSLTHTSSSV